MGQDLVEIQPRELRFTFELKKQSSCSIQLVNRSNEYVAFKVKTTSPKRYCVRPNTGVILPRSTCDFTVTMQAQRTAPPDMQLKDKFLVQCTVVPYGTADEDIIPAFFSKENGRYIEENKLRVVLVSPPESPVLQPINGALNQEPDFEDPILRGMPTGVKEAPAIIKELPTSLKESPTVLKETPTILKESPTILKETPAILKESHISADQVVNKVEHSHLSHVTEEVEDLKSKLNNLELKLEEADKMIIRLYEENKTTSQERNKLQQEMALLRRKSVARPQVGFPFLFVVFMALTGMVLGYLVHT
ncbi:vesicle-associated protein 1-2-like [Typha latifolia]|uniref:vesicle-associated protein 1-2-like n=1 Tax=Typha latifolia TaxID=4733 RepID=UPI003C2D5860